ncbi:AAEL009746-PA [Aedes aegypti]|uniref:AAEL009746-PA n=1 Tax=Aedes aegypti TaxID=7159 RepID=Q16UY6_AEDAE|nr:AAEL009746-PA [Aedes aegypti]
MKVQLLENDFHVTAWRLAGIPREKIVIIIQPTSLTYKLFQPKEYQLGTPVVRLKIRPFFKICHKLYSGSLEIYEEKARCPYAFRELSWYSYENKQSVKEKVKYVASQYLGGIAVAYYDEDDPTNLCGDGQHPLTATILSSMKGVEVSTDHKSSGIAQRSVNNGDLDSYEDVVDLHMVDAGDSHARGTDTPDPVQEASDQPLDVEADDELNKKPSVVLRQIPSFPNPPCSKCSKTLPCTTAAPPCGCDKPQKDFGSPNLLPYHFPDTIEDCDHRYVEGVPPSDGCGLCDLEPEPAIVLVDSDQAFAKLTKSSGKETLLFSEKSASCSGNTDPLFTEPKPPVVIRPPPPEAQYDPAKSRLGIIATCKNSNPPCNTNCRNCNGNPGVVGHCPFAHHIPQEALLNIIASGMAQTTAAPPSYDQAALLEMLSNIQNLARVNRNVDTPANNNQQVGNPICQYDGIIADPRDPRQYYLCRQGLPMSDENRFSCANGYVYDSANQKCVPDQN